MRDSTLVQFNCPTHLLEKFDSTLKGSYGNRTEAILDLIRKFVDAAKEV